MCCKFEFRRGTDTTAGTDGRGLSAPSSVLVMIFPRRDSVGGSPLRRLIMARPFVDLGMPVMKRVMYEKLKIGIGAKIPQHILMNADIYKQAEYLTDQIFYRLSAYLASKSTTKEEATERVLEVVKVPLTWWEHLKDRFAPLWFLRRWPVQYRYINIRLEEKRIVTTTNICPHIELPPEDRTHFEFMMCDDPFGQTARRAGRS